MSTGKRYTEEEIAAFLERAVDIGIGRAMREMKYPSSWITAKRWAENRGIDVELNVMKAKAKAYDLWYTDREVMLGAEAGMERVMESFLEDDLTPDDKKKLAEAYQKFANTWLVVNGKANNISETHHKDGMDLEIMDVINADKAKQSLNTESTTVDA